MENLLSSYINEEVGEGGQNAKKHKENLFI